MAEVGQGGHTTRRRGLSLPSPSGPCSFRNWPISSLTPTPTLSPCKNVWSIHTV
jgi:hypothetical protein